MQSGYRNAAASATERSAVEIARRVRAGEWTARAVLERHIERLLRVNPRIQAVVAERFQAARADADAVDAAPADLPLAGVPFTVKEMIEVAGMPLTFGCLARATRRGAADATVVRRLRDAGAIPIGVTNVPEWGMWPESYNHIYGRTSNPHDLRRTAGGSSGGEAAAVAAGISAVGIGSDIGGSVRLPGAFCGVFAHKPTTGLLPLTGHFPVYADGPDRDLARRAPWVTIGPLCRSASDLMPLLRVMAGGDGTDPNIEAVELGDDAAVLWEGRRVVLLDAPRIRFARRSRPGMRAAVRDAGAAFAARGAVIEEGPADIFGRAGDAWFAALQSTGGPLFRELLGAGERVRLGREVAWATVRRSRYSWPALMFCIGERVGRMGAARLTRALEELRRMAGRFDDLIGDDGVLIMPAYPSTAPRHDTVVLHPFDFLYTAVFNALRTPVTVVPAARGADGLPLGIQVAARRGRDHLTIAAARALEESGAHWHPATPS